MAINHRFYNPDLMAGASETIEDDLTVNDTLTVGGVVTFTAAATTNELDIVSAAITTGKAIDISDLSAITTGTAIHVDATGTTQTTGKLLHLDSAATAIATTGRIFLSDHTGVTSTSGVMNEFKSAANDETTIVKVTATDLLAAGVCLDVSAAAMTTGKAIDISDLDAITTGKAIHVDATGITQTTGILVHIDSASTALTGAGRLFLSDHTGASASSAILNEFASAATDETVIAKVTASGALAAGKALSISAAAMTTGTALDISDNTAGTTGTLVNITQNSADTGTRSMLLVKQDHASATGATALEVVQDSSLAAIKVTSAATSTNYFKIATMNGVTLWMGNGTTAQGNLSGTAGDILFNGGSNKPEYCTGTTNWTALV